MKRVMKSSLMLFVLFAGLNMALAQSKTYDVKSFEEVIISPHIEVVFEKSDTEAVVIENINESYDKLNVEVKGKTLHIYLDDAKVYTKSKKIKTEDTLIIYEYFFKREVEREIEDLEIVKESFFGDKKVIYLKTRL